MQGRPVTIRLLDPPLHEFLPHTAHEQAELAKKIGVSGRRDRPPRRRSCTNSIPCSATAAAAWASSIRRSRGCRPGPSSRRPATCKKAGIEVLPEVMIPLVGFATEFSDQEQIVRETADKVFAEKGTSRSSTWSAR